MRFMEYFFVFCLLTLSLLPCLGLQSIFAWKASILSTEYGHYFGLLSFALLVGTVCARTFAKHRLFLACLLGISTIVFFRPVYLLRANFPRWSKDLSTSFGDASDSTQLPNYKRLLFGVKNLNPEAPEIHFFHKESGYQLKFLFYRTHVSQKAPWLLVIHGGGWNSGDAGQLDELNGWLSQKGIAVLSVDYRLAPKWTWPAQQQDIYEAVNFVKKHAQDLGVDPSRWAILGRSAGGQIAESIAYSKVDPTLKACIAFYSPADLNFAYEFGSDDDMLHSLSLLRNYIGGTPKEKHLAYTDASPINFVNSASPPTLLLHGPGDPMVWFRQSERLLKRLQQNHVPAALIEVPWGTHGFDYNFSGPGGQLSTYAIEQMLSHFLAVSN